MIEDNSEKFYTNEGWKTMEEIQFCGESPNGIEIKLHEYAPIKFSCTINASNEEELRIYLRAYDYLCALRRLEGNFRRLDKHGFEKDMDTPHDVLDYIIYMFYKTLEGYEIDLEGN